MNLGTTLAHIREENYFQRNFNLLAHVIIMNIVVSTIVNLIWEE